MRGHKGEQGKKCDGLTRRRPQDIIVFMLGGTTYEEGRAVALLNHQLASNSAGGPGGTRILLGGSTIHNSTRYVAYTIDPLTSQLPQHGRVRGGEL